MKCRRSLVDSMLALKRRARVRMPSQNPKRNIKKIFARRFPLSRFLTKTQRVNKPAEKEVLKNLCFQCRI